MSKTPLTEHSLRSMCIQFVFLTLTCSCESCSLVSVTNIFVIGEGTKSWISLPKARVSNTLFQRREMSREKEPEKADVGLERLAHCASSPIVVVILVAVGRVMVDGSHRVAGGRKTTWPCPSFVIPAHGSPSTHVVLSPAPTAKLITFPCLVHRTSIELASVSWGM
jgi:hypothetical protein